MITALVQALHQARDHIKITVEDPLRSFRFLQRIIALVCILIPLFFRACDRDDVYPFAINAQSLSEHDAGCYEVKKIDTAYRFETRVPLLTITDVGRNERLMTARIIQKDGWGFRKSLSHYAESSNNYLFGLLYCMAAMLFIFNGVLYIKSTPDGHPHSGLLVNKGGPWYNIVIGLSLIAVVLNPLYDRQLLHVFFSVLFFFGNIVVIAFFPNPNERSLSRRARFIMAGLATVFILLPFIPHSGISVLWGEWLSLTVIALHLFLVAWYVEKSNTNRTL